MSRIHTYNIRSAQTSPMNRRIQQKLQKINDFFSSDQNRSKSSNQGKQQSIYISIVHQVIASIRDKKSQIQDFIRMQETKVEKQSTNFVIAGKSLQKLRKLHRLIDIVCKIIFNKNKTDMSLSFFDNEPNLKILQTYKNQIEAKDNQIKRLKKSIQVLTQNEKIINTKENENNSSISKSNIYFKQADEFLTPKTLAHTKKSVQSLTQSKGISFASQQKRSFQITNQFSLWNIQEATSAKIIKCQCNNKQIQAVFNNLQKSYDRKDISKKSFILKSQYSMQIKMGCNFFRHFKSILKTTINSLNMCNGLLFKMTKNCDIYKQTHLKILETTNYFNLKYKMQSIKYDDFLITQIKSRTQYVYEKIHSLLKKQQISCQ